MSINSFRIANECFINNGELILSQIKDKAGTSLKESVTQWLCQTYDLIDKPHKSKAKGTWNGFDAGDINKRLREKMSLVAGIHGETHVEYGGLFHNATKGFDFSLYDENNNYIKIRNACIGQPGLYDGQTIIKNIYKDLRSKNDDRIKMKKAEWESILASINATDGENAPEQKQSFTVVGEIQFGNWALAEHDLLRLLNSSTKNTIDYYIYITTTGKLSERLSEGVVTYSKVLDAINENAQLLYIPMWIIGLDLDL